MISEIDIRDWEKVDFEKLDHTLDELSDIHWDISRLIRGALGVCESIKQRQLDDYNKQTAALLRK